MDQNFPFEHFLKTENTAPPLTTDPIPPVSSENKTKHLECFQVSELQVINKELLNYLKNIVSEQKYATYFDSTFVLSNINNGKVIFNVPTPFIKTIIDTHYLSQLCDGIEFILGKKYEIEINVVNANIVSSGHNQVTPKSVKDVTFTIDLNPTKEDLISNVESKYIEHMNPNQYGILIDKTKTFTSFVIGPSNNLAFSASLHVAKNPGKIGRYPCLYFHSNSGLGKTHLLHSVANGIRETHPSLAICLITARDFMTEMINGIQNNNITEFRKKYSETIDVLMIDDIHELKDKQGTQNEFFHIFNELHNKGKQLIFTSDKSPKEIVGIEERIITRLQWGLVIDIQKPDLETRIAILKTKAQELDLFLPDDILNLIACNIKSSIRELEGSLIKLSAFSDVMKVDIDHDMVSELLMLNNNLESKKITPEIICKATSQHFKIPVADLKSKARSKEIAKARHIAMYLTQKIVQSTLLQIGKFYGGRDHTSVIHGVNKIKELLKTDAALSKDVILIENSF